jgi:hypothetical protein
MVSLHAIVMQEEGFEYEFCRCGEDRGERESQTTGKPEEGIVKGRMKITAETQRTQRMKKEEYEILSFSDFPLRSPRLCGESFCSAGIPGEGLNNEFLTKTH